MRKSGSFWGRLVLVMAAVALLAAACGDDSSEGGEGTTTTAAAGGPTDLMGTFVVDSADCAADTPASGSYFRMVEPGGTVEDGPFVPNGDSTCGDQSFSSLDPGAVGLTTGEYQPQPEPPFDDATNGTASDIVAPTTFFGIDFAVATNETDPQTGEEAAAPSLTADEDGTITGDLASVGVAYGGEHFNQGAPKDEGTTGPTGTYDADTGAYVLDWTSLIVGGPFDGFTGIWHLEGTFEAA